MMILKKSVKKMHANLFNYKVTYTVIADFISWRNYS